MKKLNGRELKALFILSIVAPISILVSLRLSGILRETITISETITLEAVKWEFQRPYHNQHVLIFDELGSTHTGNGISATLHFNIWDYVPGSMEQMPPGARIYIEIRINATATNPNGFVDGINAIFRNDSRPSQVIFLRTYLKFANLSLVAIKEERDPEAYTKAYVKLGGENRPSKVHFSAVGEWLLLDASSDLTHLIEAVYELTYYNGTVYKKVIQPFQLKILER